MNKSVRASAIFLVLVSISALLYSAFRPLSEKDLMRQLQQEALILPVQPLTQTKMTSCGEAAIIMAYNYVSPQSPIREADVIEYATGMGYYTEERVPFTSPENMVNIAGHYADEVSNGRVITQGQALALLVQKLQRNEPVIIDVLTRLNDPQSGAHFVVVTGVAIDSETKIIIYYNNPLTGRTESAAWAGSEGVWNAWQKNDDPGGQGWWMTIPAPL